MSEKMFTEKQVIRRENRAYRDGCGVGEKERIIKQKERDDIHTRGFVLGVLEVLTLMFNQKGITYDEIVQCIGEKQLIDVARRENRLKRSGVGEYEKRILTPFGAGGVNEPERHVPPCL